ncbi:MAG: CsbD family protein [Acidimicrobiia bacterium]
MTNPPVHDSAMATLGIEIDITHIFSRVGDPETRRFPRQHEVVSACRNMKARCLRRQEKECVMQDPTQMKWEGRWDQLKGKARQVWGDLTDDDLDVAEGNYEEFVGRFMEKTGESAEQIRQRLEEDYVDSEF